MTILVTGGTGLVGPRLLRRLVDSDIPCRGLVRPGRELPAGVERTEGDLQDESVLQRAVRGVSAVVHLAAVFRTQDESAIWRANVDGTRNLIVATRRVSPAARFILASTINVYAPDVGRPAREDDATTTQSAYAASKLAAESDLRDSGLTWSVLRFPFIYGDQDGHLEAAQSTLAGMHAHPAQRFSVLHHQDVAHAVKVALKGTFDGKIVNVAGDAPLSVYEMAQITGGHYEPSSDPLEHPWQGQVDTTLAQSLGFAPEILTAYQASRENKL